MSHFLRKIFHLPLTRLNHPMRGSHSLQCIPLLHSTGHSCDFLLVWLCDWCLSPSLDHTLHKGALLFLLITVSISLAESQCSISSCQTSPKAVQGRRIGADEFHSGNMSSYFSKLEILRAPHHTFEKRSQELGIEVTFWWWTSRHWMSPPSGRTCITR